MAAGTPVIGYACGALPEVVGDGSVLVTEGDIAALEHAVAQYLSLPAAHVLLLVFGRQSR
jgi:Glycosyl transferases group 1.